MQSRYMMATTAIHMLGDISRDDSGLCYVNREDADNYYGAWVYGIGFVNVRFPKSTTRELSAEEKAHFNGSGYAINDTYIGKLVIE